MLQHSCRSHVSHLLGVNNSLMMRKAHSTHGISIQQPGSGTMWLDCQSTLGVKQCIAVYKCWLLPGACMAQLPWLRQGHHGICALVVLPAVRGWAFRQPAGRPAVARRGVLSGGCLHCRLSLC